MRARSLSDVSKLDNIQDQLLLLRPLMIMLSLVDAIKHKWDMERLNLHSEVVDKELKTNT
jgi:hypothetical protein